ncbi:hypothetical protein ASG40_03350 [Methylobacterium sp. Leaf399]|uniref:ribbon-helix-helix domain-containing protein n=1 Tax=Methylobacterium sp. Leaf399 TaxID=1736364 RepID=UPI000712461E|nr:ribbon-helix-helix domain-containing protein [Methylobacterium sp. Leaf399]KQT20122.1 hypothetical protein ASG40_03350 [Methylobacterium sp. Leaf399]
MGRPPLNVKTMNVRLPEGVPERIDALVGNRRRAEFIRDAVVAELERREAGSSKAKPPAGAGTPEGA